MQFLKILFWCLIAFVAALFTIGNWQWVTIRLFGNLVAEVNLPLMLLLTFLLGFLPPYIYYNISRWRLRQRLGAAERTLGDIRVAAAPYAAPEPVVPAPPPTPVTEQTEAAAPIRKPRALKTPSEPPPEGGLF